MTAPSDAPPPDELRELEQILQDSHDTSIFEELQSFAGRLKKRRQAVFGAPRALLLRPIDCQQARERGIWANNEDDFLLLQGDIILTSAAYFMGQRWEDGYFAIANATCDLVPHRREYLLLIPVHAIHAPVSIEDTAVVKSLLGELLSFKSSQRMYLPPLPGDEVGIVARFINFGQIAQAQASSVAFAERVASLSIIGWRIFGVHLRQILTRASESEVELRRDWGS